MIQRSLFSYIVILTVVAAATYVALAHGADNSEVQSGGLQAQVTQESGSTELAIELQDTAESSNACDYHVRRFEYMEGLRALVLELMTEPCFVDRYGRRRGRFKWNPPAALRKAGRFCLVVNHKRLGAVVVERDRMEFRAGATEACE